MKKGIVVIAGVSAVAVFGMWFTQNAYESSVTDALTRNADTYSNMGIKLEKNAIAASFTRIEDEYTLTLTEQFFDQMDMPALYAESFDITISNLCRVYPFYMSCENEFSLPEGTLPDEFVEKLQGFTYQAGWSFSPLTNSVSSYLNTDGFTVENDGTPLEVAPLTLSSNSDLAFESLNTQMNWGGMTFNDSLTQIDIDNVNVNGDMTRLTGITYLGTSTVSIDNMVFNTADGESFSAKAINVTSNTNEYETGKYDVRYVATSSDMSIGGGALPIDIAQLHTDIRLYGLSEKALEMMNSFQGNFIEQQDMLTEMLNELGKNEPGLAIDNFSASVNNVPVSIKGEITFDQFTAEDVDTGEIAAKSNAFLNGNVGKEVSTALPQLVPMLDQYSQMGMAEKDAEGNYTTEITIKDRTLSANGNVLQQF
ncbi:DUF945 family protein [Alteromonas sp. 14N.309.X.WAT.G.H12]|uniref:DUF945 family protein n=1 Tax=Alteromonas sp. 14N.309.X.WAT.G.H12 TaxID=3120824 RepID=UPI002FD64D71